VDCVRCLGGVKLGPLNVLQRGRLYKLILHRLPRRARIGLQLLLEQRPTMRPSPAPSQQQHREAMQARTRYLFDRLRQARLLLTPSEFVRQTYAAQGLEAERIAVLPLGIDPPTRPARAASGGGPVVAYFGTLQYHKGPDVLIRAYRAAADAPGELRLYGHSDPLDAFGGQLRAAAEGDPRIRFMGPFTRDQLAATLREIDVLVLPSRAHETYSLAAREALLAGVPVIASRLGALPEAIRDGENGYLTPADDAPALAQALAAAISHLPELRAGACATRPAPTVAEHLEQLEQHYARMLGARGPNAQPGVQ
jgi:glycosyltransferase involved in cell wall biosynthesis